MNRGTCACAVAIVVLGALTASPAGAGASTVNASSVTVSSDGDDLYAGFDGAGFSAFSRDPGSGLLTPLSEAATASGGGALIAPAIAVSADGENLYGVDGAANTLFQYAGPSRLSLQSSYPALADQALGKDPVDVAVAPDGQAVYVLTYGVQFGTGIGLSSQGKISTYNRNPATGDLTLQSTLPLDPTSPSEVGEDLVVSPDSEYVYVAGSAGITVLEHTAGAGLALIGVEGATSGALGIAMSADGSSVYEAGPGTGANSSKLEIATFSRNPSTGRLSTEGEVQTGTAGPTTSSMHLAVSPDGNCVYESDKLGNALNWFTRDPNSGALTYVGTLTEGQLGLHGLASPGQVSVAGPDVYVASADDDGVGVFRRTDPTSCTPSFVQLAQDVFSLSPPTADRGDGTAALPTSFGTAGSVSVHVTPGGRPHTATISTPGTVRLPVAVAGPSATTLLDRGRLAVQVGVTFTTTLGGPVTKAISVTLKEPPSGTARFVTPYASDGLEYFPARLPTGEWARRVSLTVPGGVTLAGPIGLRSASGTDAFAVSTQSGQRLSLLPRGHLNALTLSAKLRHRHGTARLVIVTNTHQRVSESVTLTA